jgi:hypothetical protein
MTKTRLALALVLVIALGAGFASAARAATYTVATTNDLSGSCGNPPGGKCSLRELIEYEDGLATTPNPVDTIVVPSGTYHLSRGELAVTQSLNIVGAGARTTVVSPAAEAIVGRIFDVKVAEGHSAPKVAISGLEIAGGTADESNGFFGGDVYNEGSLTLQEDWITDGTASSGGGISNNTGTLLVERSLVSDNRASTGGGDSGGIQNHGSAVCGAACSPGKKAILTVEDSTVAGNQARLGGGIFSWSDAADGNEVSILDSTIVENYVIKEPGGGPRGPGAGLLVSDGTATVAGSILDSNYEIDEEEEYVGTNCSVSEPGKISSGGYNLEGGTECGFNSKGDLQDTFADFTSDEPQDNGGPTNTLAPEPAAVVVDAIPTGSALCKGTDQRGVSRPQGAGCDMGAVELVPFMIEATEGSAFSGKLAEPPGCSVYGTPTIEWGDGTNSAGTVTETGITGTHTYAQAGTYNGHVDYEDDCGTYKVPFQAKIADAALTAKGETFHATANVQFKGTVATFTDANPDGKASEFTASVEWGDGTSVAGTVSASGKGFAVTGTHTYAVGGIYSTKVTIKDVGGSKATATGSAKVASEVVPFTIEAVEGSPFSGKLVSAACPILGTPTVEWGDGGSSNATVKGLEINGSHTYVEAGTYSGSLSYEDECGKYKVPFQAKVADAALTATGVPVSATANVQFKGTVATFTDANPDGKASEYTASIEWGDGASTAGTVGASGKGFAVTGTHTYAAGGEYATKITISDVGGSKATATSTAKVSSEIVAFTIEATEGSPFSGKLVTAACQVVGTPTVEWGDGQSSNATVKGSEISGSHTYAEAGTYGGSLSYQDDCGKYKVPFQAKVADAPLTATGVSVTATANVQFKGTVATFTDANPDGKVAEYTANIEWGDGTSAAGTISASGKGFAVTGTHTYAAPGVYATKVTIKDVGGSKASATGSAKVASEVVPFTIESVEGSPFSGAMVTAACPILGTPSIEWGDGQKSNATVKGSEIRGSHTYVQAGTYNGSLSYEDDCGTYKVPFQAKVADAALTATGEALDATAGVQFKGTVATFTDANPDGKVAEYTANIEWGDGTSAAGTISAAGKGFAVSGTHTYAAAGEYATKITIKDAGGAKATATGSASVAGPPIVSNVSVVSVTETTATIGFTIDPDGEETSYVIEYGHTTGYGLSTPPVGIGASGGPQSLSRTLTGLEPGSAYHFDVIATNSLTAEGVAAGDQPFSTTPSAGSGVLGSKEAGGSGPSGGSGPAGGGIQPPLPPPVLGKTVNVELVSGKVFISLPTTGQMSLAAPLETAFASLSKGLHFIPLTEARQIPVGSTLETTAGVARITTATATVGKTQAGEFGAGIFKLLQSRKQKGLTEMDIIDNRSPGRVCASIGKKAAVAAKHLSTKTLGRLSANAHGKFSAHGQYSASTVRGTVWNVANQCDGTLTKVTRGVVSVRDFRRRKTITLFSGQHYLARAPGA